MTNEKSSEPIARVEISPDARTIALSPDEKVLAIGYGRLLDSIDPVAFLIIFNASFYRVLDAQVPRWIYAVLRAGLIGSFGIFGHSGMLGFRTHASKPLIMRLCLVYFAWLIIFRELVLFRRFPSFTR